MTASTWMLTATGADYWLSGPNVLLGNPPLIIDIAHHLAMINRYTGATSRPYSVAEHSLLVERLAQREGASPMVRMACLLHDAHEAFTNDMSTPAKQAIGLGWTGFEATHSANLRRHFGLQSTFAGNRTLIGRCDLVALATERRDLTAFDAQRNLAWPVLDTPGEEIEPSDDERLDPSEPPLDWRAMRKAFVDRYLLLRELVDAKARHLMADPAATAVAPA